jgi:CBS domain containing-hemolysin-like protein
VSAQQSELTAQLRAVQAALQAKEMQVGWHGIAGLSPQPFSLFKIFITSNFLFTIFSFSIIICLIVCLFAWHGSGV